MLHDGVVVQQRDELRVPRQGPLQPRIAARREQHIAAQGQKFHALVVRIGALRDFQRTVGGGVVHKDDAQPDAGLLQYGVDAVGVPGEAVVVDEDEVGMFIICWHIYFLNQKGSVIFVNK